MNTLKNHLILYDAECPMCNAYTKGFTQLGMLDKQGRLPYQEFPAAACPLLDRERAVNEIALVNQETGEVTYGIKSLFKIFGTTVPFLKPLFEFAPFVWLMSKAYALISYNRRVIIPGKQIDHNQVQPAVKLHYRIAYLIVTCMITGLILTNYVKLMAGIIPQGSAWREYLVCGGQLIFQGIIVSFTNPKQRWAYLGNMMTISTIGALLLLPALMMHSWVGSAPVFFMIWFIGTAALMLLLHIKRTRLLAVNPLLSLSWVVYRLIVLILVIIL
jgi:predicted DCC family thiol-disulfide oxidoreductase YuxK